MKMNLVQIKCKVEKYKSPKFDLRIITRYCDREDFRYPYNLLDSLYLMSWKVSLKDIALARIDQLFLFARKRPDYATRYVFLARKLAMKVNLHIPLIYKRRFCQHCYTYFKQNNYMVRTREGKVVVFCLTCKKFWRRPFKS